ncbi:MAG: pantoate--beta-alanine ligase, partial [Planctomycetes bacterium]|nr:pantoate--beta-alanine ligase [Planctomycetota bacterium]
MLVSAEIDECRRAVRQAHQDGQPVGLVPTMGALHEGHLSLVRQARLENDCVTATIFVNPTQFCAGEDFERYPRDEERDMELLQNEGVDWVFIPSTKEIFPNGFSTYIEPPKTAQGWCGASRPGHFRGVCTVVFLLLNFMQPTRAYFGQKDAQQCAVIRSMVQDLQMPVEIKILPTVREADGIALSSRNAYLSAT